MKFLFDLLLVLVFSVAWNGCGTDNLYKDVEKKDAAEDAAIHLENNDPDGAIDILEKALRKSPDDRKLISLLSAAYAQRGGVSLIDLALNMAENSDNGTGDEAQNAMTALWPLLPDASAEVIADLNEALTLLRSIPADSRTTHDSFKLAIIGTAYASLQMKRLDTNGDGRLSFQELAAQSARSADSILEALLGASSALATLGNELGDSSNLAASQISELVNEINNSEGDNSAEKLSNYFKQN